MARYVPLGHRISTRLGRLFDSMSHFPPYRWSEDILRRMGISGALGRHRRALDLAAAVLPDPVHHRAEDQLCGHAASAVPPYTALFDWGEDGYVHLRINIGELPVLC